MPIYEYKCKKCGHKFEEFQSIGATNESLNCNEPKPERVLSVFGSGSGGGISVDSGGCSSSSPFS